MKGKGKNIRNLLFLGFFLLLGRMSPAFGEEWATLSTEHFYIHHVRENQKVAKLMGLQAERIYREVVSDLGYTPKGKVSVYLCPTETCFQEKQPYPESVPDWAVGVAYPSLNWIVIRSSLSIDGQASDPAQIFKHEFAHIALEQAIVSGAPRWLSEGFAMYQAREWGLPKEAMLREAALLDTFIPLTELTRSFPREATQARIAYAQSLSLITYIINTYGKEAFHRLIKNLGEGVSPETALRRATGVELIILERDWQRALREKHSWIPVITSLTALWGLITIIFLGAYLCKKWRVREIEKTWEEEGMGVWEHENRDKSNVLPHSHTPTLPHSP